MGIPCFSKIYLKPHLFEERPRVGEIFRREWIYIYIYIYGYDHNNDSHCCMAETNITL